MKAKIGKFNSRWVTYPFEKWCLEKLHGKYHFEIKESEYTQLDKFIEKVCDAWQIVLNITINKWYYDKQPIQKVKVKIDDWDTYSADSTLAYIILPLLKEFKKNKQGAPLVDNEDVPKELESPYVEHDVHIDTDDYWFDRFDYVLDEIIWTFEQYNIDWEDQYHTGNIDFKFVPVDKDGNEVPHDEAKLFKMERGENDTSRFDEEGYQAHQARINNGLRLFGKYYGCLWT